MSPLQGVVHLTASFLPYSVASPLKLRGLVPLRERPRSLPWRAAAACALPWRAAAACSLPWRALRAAFSLPRLRHPLSFAVQSAVRASGPDGSGTSCPRFPLALQLSRARTAFGPAMKLIPEAHSQNIQPFSSSIKLSASSRARADRHVTSLPPSGPQPHLSAPPPSDALRAGRRVA